MALFHKRCYCSEAEIIRQLKVRIDVLNVIIDEKIHENKSIIEYTKQKEKQIIELKSKDVLIQSRMDILNGMLNLAYAEIIELKKLRHCSNCKHGSKYYLKRCDECICSSKWEA